MIGDGRDDRSIPPCDALAERIVLHRALSDPALIDTVELSPLLVFPLHRQVWHVLVDVRKRFPDLQRSAFLERCIREIAALPAVSCAEYLHVLYPEEEWDRAFEEAESCAREPDGCALISEHAHSTAWWLDSLRRIRTARERIQAAQRLAELYWRVPTVTVLDAEVAMLVRAFLPQQAHRADVGMEIPV